MDMLSNPQEPVRNSGTQDIGTREHLPNESTTNTVMPLFFSNVANRIIARLAISSFVDEEKCLKQRVEEKEKMRSLLKSRTAINSPT